MPDLAFAEVRSSDLHGQGAFALRNLSKGREIGYYEGRRYPPGEANDRDWDNAVTYVFGLSDGTLIDGSEGGNLTRHINHSCEPNCVAFEIEGDDGVARIMIETRRRIRAGEELTLDYGLQIGDQDTGDYACRCGARRCRGTLLGVRDG